ncbi:MAG: hypothetical protein WCB97_08905 [Thiobacillus sp.]
MPDEVSFGFAAPGADIDFMPELDHYNFRELARGDLLGRAARPGCRRWTKVGDDIGDRLFEYRQGGITLKKSLMPAMLTRDTRVIRQDCLCYLMERIPYP